MKLRFITFFIIATNSLLLMDEIPFNVISLVVGSLFLSLYIHHPKVRTITKVMLLAGSLALLRFHFKSLLVTESAISLIMILSALKFWELNEERDHFNMFLILSLAECSIFLITPTFMVFLWGMSKMIFYFYYILKMRNYDHSLLSPKRLLLLMTPSILLALILFYTFPRFTQGFINSSEMQQIISGGNSRLDFKQLGPLTPSKELAFKVYGLEKSNLPFKLLYWKSSVLWQLSGQEWSASNNNLKITPAVLLQPRFKYDVEMFQNLKEYLPVLDGSSVVMFSNLDFNSYSDGSFKLRTISRGNLNYSVVGNYGDRPQVISPLMEKKGLKLNSPRAEEVRSHYLTGATHSFSDETRMKELIQIFKKQEFLYSISPPTYNSVEDFLLAGKQGYCSHFAAAFTYLARLYQLPARIVVGYLGGEFNPYDNSVLVRELDAHAWVEIFIKDRGWLKVDPTSLVVPERLAMSAEEFNNKLNPYITIFNFQISRELFRSGLVNNFSLWLDSLNSKFNTNIFNFDREKQLAILRSLTPGNLSIGWIFVLSLCLFFGVFWLLFTILGKTKLNPDQKRYLKFLRKMDSHGLKKGPDETITRFKKRCLAQIPNETSYIEQEVTHYINSFYK